MEKKDDDRSERSGVCEPGTATDTVGDDDGDVDDDMAKTAEGCASPIAFLSLADLITLDTW